MAFLENQNFTIVPQQNFWTFRYPYIAHFFYNNNHDIEGLFGYGYSMTSQWDQNFDEVGFEFSSKYGLTRYFQSFLLIQESGNVFKLKLLQKAFYPIVKYISVTVSGVRSMRVCHSYVGNFLNDPLSNLAYTCFMKDDMHTWAKLVFIYSICTKPFVLSIGGAKY